MYIDILMKDCDLFFLHEHWLYIYEKSYVADQLPDIGNIVKCCDEFNQQPMMHRHRGHGGVLALWCTDMDKCVEPLECGCESYPLD